MPNSHISILTTYIRHTYMYVGLTTDQVTSYAYCQLLPRLYTTFHETKVVSTSGIYMYVYVVFVRAHYYSAEMRIYTVILRLVSCVYLFSYFWAVIRTVWLRGSSNKHSSHFSFKCVQSCSLLPFIALSPSMIGTLASHLLASRLITKPSVAVRQLTSYAYPSSAPTKQPTTRTIITREPFPLRTYARGPSDPQRRRLSWNAPFIR